MKSRILFKIFQDLRSASCAVVERDTTSVAILTAEFALLGEIVSKVAVRANLVARIVELINFEDIEILLAGATITGLASLAS